ncbi:DUF397 domain-containing protein [Actinomadura sp. LCR2-06]|uniref:DUF397 domain-containing protein n=1 Tax=Actinomadura violacea TaxID=2819934 RepID=A0ABS3SAY1_9ACTN|nr:DUF397 domain-containing protein [Actinomadura violacea]
MSGRTRLPTTSSAHHARSVTRCSAVRDSKDPDGPKLLLNPGERVHWRRASCSGMPPSVQRDAPDPITSTATQVSRCYGARRREQHSPRRAGR